MADTLPAGLPQAFSPAAPAPANAAAAPARRTRSAAPTGRAAAGSGDAEAKEKSPSWLDPPELKVPCGGRRWLPRKGKPISANIRREVRALLNTNPPTNDFSGWQMPFPYELPSGEPCPICTLGECGDVNCATYRPKRPEIRRAIEGQVVEEAMRSFAETGQGLDTFVSVGAGLLAQDWIILEQLRAAAVELQPRRAIFVELRTIGAAVACEGRQFKGDLGLDLRQIGFSERLGPEFSFSAVITFAGAICCGSRIFDFCDHKGKDNIFVEVQPNPSGKAEDVGVLMFGVRRGDRPEGEEVQGIAAAAWVPEQPHLYMFSISATGTMRIHIDGQLAGEKPGHPPRRVERRHLYVGQNSEKPDHFFQGEMRKIKVWDHCVDTASVEGLFADEAERALSQFATWFANDLSVYTFGSLASYASAVGEDPRFAADLLLRIDVHDEIDGYDDFVGKVLSQQGVALTLGGPGRSWRKRGTKLRELELHCKELESAVAKRTQPWVHFGPGRVGHCHACNEESHFMRLWGWPATRHKAGRRRAGLCGKPSS
eukprot:TRINITY_DN73883_c0_g1_i1.p1 TRINITY_DN73883_c0_g1~~TRINITY_DN73883_c0_g1_i1.p1  ORF type:complete len:542 (+),score=89.72 TRINITY_DN73883_c0_g1_i1:46-1671(+)